jgi:hypothetical protein
MVENGRKKDLGHHPFLSDIDYQEKETQIK